MYLIGTIVRNHGLRGEVRVKQITDFSERFAKGNTVYVEETNGKGHKALEISSVRPHKHALLVSFKDYNSLSSVEPFIGSDLFITEEQLTPLEEGEYYYHEIIGCTVWTTEDDKIGTIESILSPGANDVWVVKGEQKQEILIPYIRDVVKEIDIARKKVIIQLMEGLID